MKIVGYHSFADGDVRNMASTEAAGKARIADYAKQVGGEVEGVYGDQLGRYRANLFMAVKLVKKVGGLLAVVAEDTDTLPSLLTDLVGRGVDCVLVSTPNRPDYSRIPHAIIPVPVSVPGNRVKAKGGKRRLSKIVPERRGTVAAKMKRDAKAMPVYREAWGTVSDMADEGASLGKMADYLNSQGVKTAGGGKWTPIQVSRLVSRAKAGELA